MNSRKFFDWCRTAVGKIWYKPDRDDVQKELYNHMLDRYDSLLERGYTPAEAERMTLQAMGDAAALSVDFKKAHNTFCSKTIVVSRWIIAVLLLPVMLMFAWTGVQILSDTLYHSVINPFVDNNVLTEKVTAVTDGYTITVTEAKTEGGYVYAVVKVNSLSHLAGDDNVLKNFEIVDSKGNRTELTASNMLGYRSGLTEYTYLIKCRMSYSKNPGWFQLRCDRAGRNVVLHVDLAG